MIHGDDIPFLTRSCLNRGWPSRYPTMSSINCSSYADTTSPFISCCRYIPGTTIYRTWFHIVSMLVTWYKCDVSMNTLRLRPNCHHIADEIFECICLNKNVWISLKISLKFVPKVRINTVLALVQIMTWQRPGDKPLSKPMMDSLLTHICTKQPQWVNRYIHIHTTKICIQTWKYC